MIKSKVRETTRGQAGGHLVNPAGVYVSIPFCRQKCTYCNFASDVHPPSSLSRYLNRLLHEITHRSELWQTTAIPAWRELEVDSIYMGGGTPGLLESGQFRDILNAIEASFTLHQSAEVTIEVSPENVTPGAADAWVSSGINRISMGVQSMIPAELRAVGRIHTAETVAAAFGNLRSAGISNVSADLIAGLPKQTEKTWQHSLNALLELDPAHLSVYMLEVDEDSRLGREILHDGRRYKSAAVPSDDQVADFYCVAMELLRAAGFEHYEISNFSLPGRRSRHNDKYWSNVPYFGFGLDAHSYDGTRRWANTDSLATYLERLHNGQAPVTEQKTLCPREKMEERFFLGLRRREGVSLSRLDSEFSILHNTVTKISEQYAGAIRQFCKAGWLESEGDSLRLTDRGLLFSNEVFAGFLEENE